MLAGIGNPSLSASVQRVSEPRNMSTPSSDRRSEPERRAKADSLRGLLVHTALRVRLQRAIDASTLFAVAGLGLAGLAVALTKTDALPEADAALYLWGCAALPLLAGLVGVLRPVRPLLVAKLIDRSHDLDDRVSNAIAFAREEAPTAFMSAAMDDAAARASKLSPKAAMPLRLPRELVAVVGLSIGVGLLGFLEVPRVFEERIPFGGIDPVRLHADDIDAYESSLRDLLADPDTNDEVRAAAREFNRIIEDIADERLDREESLRRIADLERRLQRARPADAELMRESLRELGEDLRRSNLANELSAALNDADAARAEAEMRRLAERVRQDETRRRDLESLRRALARAAERRALDRSDDIQRREEQLNRLLRRQRERTQPPSERDRRLLQRRRRELDRLRRQHREAMDRQRQLERLRRELRRTAESLGQREQQRAADDLERGAQDLNRMARSQMSEEDMRQLERQLRELRELIRRARQQQAQGQRGRGRQGQGQGRMDRFVLRARGQGDGEGVQLGVPGQGGQQGQQGQGQGQGQEGRGQGEQPQMLVLGGQGEANAILEIPGMGQQQQSGGQGGGQREPGPGAGTGHDPTTLDDPTRTASTHRTVRVEGQQGEGPSRSEVIMSSAQRGFANRPYEETYTEYRGHAEEVLERDEVPPGYRSYVRRYFQLIRPRE